jgi:serine/threonine protein kinase
VPEDFKFGEELGRGSYSVVLRGIHLASGRPFAIKILDKAHLVTHKKQRYAQVEVEALKRLSNAPPASHRPSGSAGSTSSPTTIDLSKTPTRPKSRRTYSGRGGGDGECGGGHGDASGSSTLPTSDSMKTVRASPARSRTAMPMEFTAQMARAPTPRLNHPGTVKLAFSFQDSASLYFALDLVPNGEILGLIRQLGSLALTPARHYAAEIVDAVGWMHDRGVLHRDLKPENILRDADWHIKIADFGSAKVFPLVDGKVTAAIGPSSSSSSSTGQSNERVSSHSMTNTPKRSFVGTAEYVSPEVLLNEATSTA